MTSFSVHQVRNEMPDKILSVPCEKTLNIISNILEGRNAPGVSAITCVTNF